MTDLTKTIAPKSDQLNADDLITGPRTITVREVRLLSDDQPIGIYYEGDNGKPYKPCKSMRRVMVLLWGGDGKAYTGRSMTIYRDENVAFGGAKVGGIRISHMSHIDKEHVLSLTATKAQRKPFTVKPLRQEQTRQAEPQFDADAFEAEVRDKALAATNADALKAWANSDEIMTKRARLKALSEDRAGAVRSLIAARIGELTAGADV